MSNATYSDAVSPDATSTDAVSPDAMADAAFRWRDLAERRRKHFVELQESGRWKHYYSTQEFLEGLREAHTVADRWARIAPRPGEATTT